MKKRQFIILGMIFITCTIYAGGHKEIDSSWYKDYTDEEKKLISKYEIENSDLSKFKKVNQLLDDIADISLYGCTMEDINMNDMKGYMRDVIDDPLHALDYYDSYINSLTYNEISKKWFISKAAYNDWVFGSMWTNSLKQTEELKREAESQFFKDFPLPGIYSLDQLNAINAYAGFTDKLKANGNGLVGKTLVRDVLSFAEHVLNNTNTAVFNKPEFYVLVKDRFKDDLATMHDNGITVDDADQAIINEFRANLERYSNILYRARWFDKTYISYYYQDIPNDNTVGIQNWDLGVGATIGYPFTGITVSGYLEDLEILGYIGNDRFNTNVAFGIGLNYHWQIHNGHHIGIGLNAYNKINWHISSATGKEANNKNDRYEDVLMGYSISLKIPINYKYFFQNIPVMISITATPSISLSANVPKFSSGITAGIQYLLY